MLLIGLCASLWATPGIANAEIALPLTFQGRTADLAPYYYAFPYRLSRASIEYEKLYFSRHVEGEGRYLFVTDWDSSSPITLDSDTATKVTDVDLNTINFWKRELNTRLNGLVARADDDKTERINLWLFADGADLPVRLTDVDYVYKFAQSADHSQVYYTARHGPSDNAKGCLEVLRINGDGSTETQQLVCDDNPEMPARINWWAGLRADSERVVFPALKNGDRNKQELYTYSLSDGAVTRLFSGHGYSWVSAWEIWGNESEMLFSADRDLYHYDFETSTASLLKTFDRSIANVGLAGPGDTPPILVETETPFESTLHVLDIRNGRAEVLKEYKSSEDVWLADSYEGAVLVGKFSADTYAAFEMFNFEPDGSYAAREAVEGLSELNDQLSRCDVERVQVKHEDMSDATPGSVDLDVFLYLPRNPPANEKKKYIITAYYGGANEFSAGHHLWCELGITSASPAVRGDWRYGTEFANSNDRDGADAPVRDTLAVARYLMERFEIPDSRQIGTTGYSHGGWAAVRAISYPGPERIELGFALAGGGFYDLPAVVDPEKKGETNIHGWFDKEFGTSDQKELLLSLSPSNHLDWFSAPVFLYHGELDTRVSANQARSLADRLENAGKDVTLMIVPDQGHSIRGPENLRSIDQGMLDLIESTP